MAVLIEAISVVARRMAIAERFQGGWPAFQRMIPNATGCFDNDLVRVGFMTPDDVQAFVSQLTAGGLLFRQGEEVIDVAVVDQFRGPTIPAPWLQIVHVKHGEKYYVAAALVGQNPIEVAVPQDWEFNGSLSDCGGFVAEGTEGDRLKYLRHENGIDVYLDLITGKEVFVGRPTVEGDTEAALFTRLRKICQEALKIEAESEPLKALGDQENAAPLYDKLLNRLLPEAVQIVVGPGNDMALAHFTHGLILRILQHQSEAELAFRKANDLQPGTINTLRELVRCLGEQKKHREALPFARKAVEVEPTDSGAWGNLAMCLIECKQREDARKAIDHAIDLDPQDPINRYIRDNFERYSK